MGAFGDKLRQQREQRGIALETISTATKISPRMLRALEEEHFDQLPGGVFNKGFVRAYARQVGLNEEEAVAEYLEALRESQIQAQQILPEFRNPALRKTAPTPFENPIPAVSVSAPEAERSLTTEQRFDPAAARVPQDVGDNRNRRRGDRRRPEEPLQVGNEDSGHVPSEQATPRGNETFSSTPSFITLSESTPASSAEAAPTNHLRNTIAAAILVVTVGVSVWSSRHHRESHSSPSAPSNRIGAASLKPAEAVGAPATLAAAVPSGEPLAKASAVTTPPVNSAPPISHETSNRPASVSAAATSSVNSSSKPKPNLPPTKSGGQPASSKPPSAFTLLVRAEKTTWVLVTADGKPVAQETLIAPAHASFRATQEIVVRAGNAAGISFQFNGKEVPAKGAEGEVKTYVFDTTGVRTLSQSQSAGER